MHIFVMLTKNDQDNRKIELRKMLLSDTKLNRLLIIHVYVKSCFNLRVFKRLKLSNTLV